MTSTRFLARLLFLFCLPLLAAGCAELTGNKSRSGEIELRVPGTSLTEIDENVERVNGMIGALAIRYGLSLQERRDTSGDVYIGPGMPPAARFNYDAATTWTLRIPRSGDISDTVSCSVAPPKANALMSISVFTVHAGRTPATALELWDAVLAQTTKTYGASALVKVQALR